MGSFSNLPEEITVDILSRLPAKSLGRCRCVSKLWLALLTRPEFIKTHLGLARIVREESLIFISDSQWLVFYSPLSNAHHLFDEITLSTPTQFRSDGYPDYFPCVYASCDGLLLVDGELLSDKLVLNPITRETREVPISPFVLHPYRAYSYVIGFGYDSVSDDYKIVIISYYVPEMDDYAVEPQCTDMIVNVYSLRSGSWRSRHVEGFLYYDSNAERLELLRITGVFVHGCVHFLGRRTTDYGSLIMAFDLVEEKFHEVPPPSSINNCAFKDELAQVGGCLCWFQHYESDVWEFWMMKEYGVAESWTKFSIIDSEPWRIIQPLCLFEQEYLVVSRDHNKLAMYSLKQGSVKEIEVPSIVEDLHAKVSFVESLISPHAWW